LDLPVRAFRLQVADLFLQLLQLGLEGANVLPQRVHNTVCIILSLNRGSELCLCALCARGKIRDDTAVFVSRARALTL